MSMFNMVAGYDPLAEVVLSALGASPEKFPRFRDAYFDFEHANVPLLVVMTRTGGGNRAEYEKKNNPELEGPSNDDMREIDGYLGDRDDDYDSTFAHFTYRVPERHMEAVLSLVEEVRSQGWDFPKPMDRMKRML